MTTVSGDQRAGCLIGFHAQCSIEPPRYVIWLSKANHTLRVGLASRFTVHFLSEGDHDLAEVFGGTSSDDVDKFNRCDWHEGSDGVPLLDRVPNRLIGLRCAVLDEGSDHLCLVIEPDQSTSAARSRRCASQWSATSPPATRSRSGRGPPRNAASAVGSRRRLRGSVASGCGQT